MKRITINPNIRFGKPHIRNTRIAVADVLNLLASGYTMDEIPEQYPGLTRQDVVAALDFAASLTEKPVTTLAQAST